MADTRSLINGLRGIMHGILEATQAFRNVEIHTGQLPTENIAMNNLISEIRSLVSEVSEVVEHSFFHQEGGMIEGNNAGTQLGLSVSGIAGGIGTLSIGGSRVLGGAQISNALSKAAKTFQVIRNLTDFEQQKDNLLHSINEINSVLLHKIDSFSPDIQDGINDTRRYIQQFIDDLIFYNLQGYDIIQIQADRLRQSFQNWQNAFCYYSQELFFRFPILRHNSEPTTVVPNHQIDYIISKQLNALCYLLLDELWCNWTKFLQIVSGTDFSVSNHTKCSWDFLALRLHRDLRSCKPVPSRSCRRLL